MHAVLDTDGVSVQILELSCRQHKTDVEIIERVSRSLSKLTQLKIVVFDMFHFPAVRDCWPAIVVLMRGC